MTITRSLYKPSETYVGYAWEFLRRNPDYRTAFDRSRASRLRQKKMRTGGSIFRTRAKSKAANKWGLESFVNPALDYLQAPVFWSRDAFPNALTIDIEPITSANLTQKCIQFSDILCTRHHLLTDDGARQTVLKSPYFWLQFSGKPDLPTHEKGRIIVRVDGNSGMRKRLNVLQNLADLRDGKSAISPESDTRQTYENLQFYADILDLKAEGMSYRDISRRLIGEARTDQEWVSGGCSLKSKIVRGAARGLALSQYGYRQLLIK